MYLLISSFFLSQVLPKTQYGAVGAAAATTTTRRRHLGSIVEVKLSQTVAFR